MSCTLEYADGRGFGFGSKLFTTENTESTEKNKEKPRALCVFRGEFALQDALNSVQ